MGIQELDEILLGFTWHLNKSEIGFPITGRIADIYGDEMAYSLLKQFGKTTPEPERLRMSALGMPAVYQLLPLLGYGKFPEDRKEMSTRETFHRGDAFEARIRAMLRAYDTNLSVMGDVELVTEDIAGHADIVIGGYGATAVIEVKSVNGYYWNKAVSNLAPYDDRGYFSQLTSYLRASGADKGYWLMQNADTKKVALLPVEKNDPRALVSYARIDALIPRLKKVHTLEQMFSEFDIPEPETACVKRGSVCFKVVPENMTYAPKLHCLYELSDHPDSKRKQVLRVRDKQEAIDCIKNSPIEEDT